MSDMQVWLLEPAQSIIQQVSQFFIYLLLVIFILIIGWLLSKLLKVVVVKLLKTLKLDVLADKIELDELLKKGGLTYTLSELIGVIFYWIGLLVTFMSAMNAVQFTIAAELLNKVVLYIPNIIAAIFILILGMFMATLLKNIVKTAANNAGLSQSNLLSKIVEVVVGVFAVIMTISIVLASLGLALALAFGLGCKDIAAKFTAELIESVKGKK
jgi:hypothetical protein